MRKYLATLHKRPDHHKKRFAFLAASTITLFIFGVWSLATFGISGTKQETVAKTNEVSPFESIRTSLAASIESIGASFGELKSSFETINLESKYIEMRDGALDVYDR